jgi:membrane protein implicated in regulation of membrane protease activity
LVLSFWGLKSVINYFWLTLGLVVLLFELFFPGLFFFLSLFLGCFLVAMTSKSLQLMLWGQCMLALASSFCFFVILQQYFKIKKDKSSRRSNIEKLVGMEGIVVEEVTDKRIGRVKLTNESWPAVSEFEENLQKKSVVIVVGVQGNKLVVNRKN